MVAQRGATTGGLPLREEEEVMVFDDLLARVYADDDDFDSLDSEEE